MNPNTSQTTLFIGLGKMGAPMVQQYATAHKTLLFDSNHEVASALAVQLDTRALPSLSEVGKSVPSADISTVIMMLPTSAIVERVLTPVEGHGLFDALHPGTLVIDMGSSVPSSTRALAARAAELSIDYVDAPVSGGVPKAIAGTLAVMMGGEPTARARARQHVSAVAAEVIEVGPSGAGHSAKALNNWLSAANIAAASEVLAVAAKAGIAPDVMIATLNASTGRSQATEVKCPAQVLTGAYNSGFAFDLMRKDVGIGADLADELDSYTPVLNVVLQTVDATRELLDSEVLDHTDIARFYEKKNHVDFSG